MTEEQLINLIEDWDDIKASEMAGSGEATDPDDLRMRKANESPHSKMKRDLWFLMDQFYQDYALNRPTPFITVFLRWLGQFDGPIHRVPEDPHLAVEKRYAFILARKLMYVTERQMRSLIAKVWNDMLRLLFQNQCKQYVLSPIANFKNEALMREALSATLVVPLSDSGRLMEFRHEGLPENITLESINLLLDPIKVPKMLATEKAKFASKTYLFIIEDFSGSGTTAAWRIKKIINKYEFKNIYFCPLVVSKHAVDGLSELETYAAERGKSFSIISGIEIGPEYSITTPGNNNIWTVGEKEALKEISEKYFASHFRTNKHLFLDFKENRPKKPAPYGFMNCGLAVVMHSNCPNNSLPIIWESRCNWKSLFKRHERYEV